MTFISQSISCLLDSSGESTDNSCNLVYRDRVHMLLAALSLMHEQIHQAGNAKRCQLVEVAITHFVKRFRPVLLDNSQQDEAAPVATSGQPVAWQQVRTQYNTIHTYHIHTDI